MRITLKEKELKAALLSYVAGLGVGGDAVNTADVVFTKGRKGNGLTAEIVIGEDPAEVAAEAEAQEAAESVEAPAQTEVAAEAVETEDAFA